MWIALLAAACVAPPPDADKPPGGDTATGVACSEIPATVTASVTDMPTVVRVTWETAEVTEGFVRYAEADGVARTTALTSGTTHEALLVGLHSLARVDFEVVVNGAPACDTVTSITAGALPAGVPALTASVPLPDRAEGGYTVVPILTSDATFVTVLDAAGTIVWAYDLLRDGPPPAVPRALLSLDGDAILFNESGVSVSTPGNLYRLSLDGSELLTIPVNGGHTDFVEWAPHQYAVLGWEIRTFEGGRKLLGDTVVLVDDSGAATVLWSVFDWLEPDLGQSWSKGWYVPDPQVEDWSHVNGVSYDPDEDAFFVTMTLESSVARIERTTGAMTWRLSDAGGDFRTDDPEPMVSFPHSVQNLGESVLVFNRASPSRPDECSEAVEIALDADAGTATRTWAYRSEACLLVPFLGGAQRLPGGNTLVDFTASGQLDEATPDGELAWRVNTALGGAFGYATRVAALGPSDE